MNFLSPDDYKTKISLDLLAQLTENDPNIIDDAERDAAELINDRIGDKYRVVQELQTAGEARNRTLVRWMRDIAVYFLYARTHDDNQPERVIKDYDDTIKELDKIAIGKYSCNLSRVQVDGNIRTGIRMGSNKPRTHNPYEL